MSESQVMLVTGGTGSIGRVVAAQALAQGWRVAVHGRSEASVRTWLAQLEGVGVQERVLGLDADLAQPGAAATLIERTSSWGGRLDAVVDCVSMGPSGIRLTGPFSATDPPGYAALLDFSVAHLQRLAHAALPWLMRRGGTFIAFASDAGRFAASGQALIGAARAAIMGFVRNLAVEVARDGVRVHCISPSFVLGSASAQRLPGRSAERMEHAAARAGLGLPVAEDIAPLVLFLCGEGARRITGQVISVNGGLHA
jgi:NAD(P)-dependent dehydrogenase (short-subunit alcohol dehydrogenase family)